MYAVSIYEAHGESTIMMMRSQFIELHRNLGLWVRDDGSGISVWEFSLRGLGFRVPDRIHS